MKNLTGHNSFETAYKIENYPWGFKLRTTQFVWVETLPKKGDRIIRQTIDPRTGELCAAKASTFSPIKWLFIDENGHVQSTGLNIYTNKETVTKCIEQIGVENLNKEQRKQYNQLMGINEVKTDEFTGAVKKDFSVKWETEILGRGWERVEKEDGTSERVWNKGTKGKTIEVKITFDRPDGVKLIEIFRAMKSLNQTKLAEIFEIREDKHFGDHAGVVRICCRNGVYLGQISEKSYKEYLASDQNQIEEEKQNQLTY